MQSITPCFWFDHNAEEAVKFYASIFKNSKIGRISRYGKAGFEVHKMKEGTAMVVEFELNGSPFTALNGGPIFKFNEAISLQVHCKTQEEIDHYWNKLGEGGDGRAQQCGWLKDKFGLSWQIVPEKLGAWMTDPDAAKRDRVMAATMQMKKLDIAAMQRAFDGT